MLCSTCSSVDYLQSLIMMVPRLAALRVAARLLDKKVQVLFGLVIQKDQNEACDVSQCRLGFGADLSKGGFSSYHIDLVDVSYVSNTAQALSSPYTPCSLVSNFDVGKNAPNLLQDSAWYGFIWLLGIRRLMIHSRSGFKFPCFRRAVPMRTATLCHATTASCKLAVVVNGRPGCTLGY